MVTRDARKLLGMTRWNRLALDKKVWGRKFRRLGLKIGYHTLVVLLVVIVVVIVLVVIILVLSYRWHS